MRRNRGSLVSIVVALAAIGCGALLTAACAAGIEGQDDDDPPGPDSSVSIDGPPGAIDARPIDASLPIDGSFPIDASLPIDAPQTGACTTTADCSSMPGTCCDILSSPSMCVIGLEIPPLPCIALN